MEFDPYKGLALLAGIVALAVVLIGMGVGTWVF